MACMTEAQEGTRIVVDDDEAIRFRAQMIELMMMSHPHDCPVCDEGGECHLQDMTVMTGHSYRRYRGRKRTFRNQDLGPFVAHEMNRCITCYRCTRFYNDYAGGRDFGVVRPAQPGVLRPRRRRTARERVQRQPGRGLPHRGVHRQDARAALFAQVGPADGPVGVPPLRPRLHDDARGAVRRAAPRPEPLQPRDQQDVPLRPRPLRLPVRQRGRAGPRGEYRGPAGGARDDDRRDEGGGVRRRKRAGARRRRRPHLRPARHRHRLAARLARGQLRAARPRRRRALLPRHVGRRPRSRRHRARDRPRRPPASRGARATCATPTPWSSSARTSPTPPRCSTSRCAPGCG